MDAFVTFQMAGNFRGEWTLWAMQQFQWSHIMLFFGMSGDGKGKMQILFRILRVHLLAPKNVNYLPFQQCFRFGSVVATIDSANEIPFITMSTLMQSQFGRASSAEQTIRFVAWKFFHRYNFAMTVHVLLEHISVKLVREREAENTQHIKQRKWNDENDQTMDSKSSISWHILCLMMWKISRPRDRCFSIDVVICRRHRHQRHHPFDDLMDIESSFDRKRQNGFCYHEELHRIKINNNDIKSSDWWFSSRFFFFLYFCVFRFSARTSTSLCVLLVNFPMTRFHCY